MPTQAITKVKHTLTLPEPLSDKYAERAVKAGHPVESELLLRLVKCQDHTASQPIYLNDSERQELSRIAGQLITSPADLLKWANSISTMQIDNIKIHLTPRLLSRIESRRFGSTLAETITKMTIESLEQLVGLR